MKNPAVKSQSKGSRHVLYTCQVSLILGNIVDDLSRIISPVLKLQAARDSWVRREISYFDFDTGRNSYRQRMTLDVDQSQVDKICEPYSLKHAFIPLYWRKKEPMYAMDCNCADGRTLRLLNKEFNEQFSELAFWWYCNFLYFGNFMFCVPHVRY